MLLNCVFVGLGGAAGSICRYRWAAAPETGTSGFPAITPVYQYRRCLCAGPPIGALAGKYAKLNPQLSVPSGGGCAAASPPSLPFPWRRQVCCKAERPALRCCIRRWPAVKVTVGAAGGSGWCGKTAKETYKMAPDKLSGAIFLLIQMPVSFRSSSGKDRTPLLMNCPAKRAISSGDSLVPS